MTTNKLKLKRTPEEEAARQLKKERKSDKKRKRQQRHATTAKRFHAEDSASGSTRKWASNDEEDFDYGPQPAKSNDSEAKAMDYEALKAEIEDRRFREKMFDALGDDERIDGLEAQLNDFAHVPEHWRSSSTAGLGKAKTRAQVYGEDEFLTMDPSTMDDEEYAEWVRIGMYRKTHAEEYAEQQRKKAERAARKAEEKARRADAKKMEKLAEEEDKAKKVERDMLRFEQAREEYQLRWIALLASANDNQAQVADDLTFRDVPWPVVAAYRRPRSRKVDNPDTLVLEDLSSEAISAFLLPIVGLDLKSEEEQKKDRKERLREAILRFHPDKFEGRFMKRVTTKDQEMVRNAIRQVIGVLNSLL